MPVKRIQSATNLSGFWYGSGRSKMALTTLNSVVLAPILSASVRTTTAVKPGFFISWRKA